MTQPELPNAAVDDVLVVGSTLFAAVARLSGGCTQALWWLLATRIR